MDHNPRRGDWLFQYPVGALLRASQERLVYHENKREWWDAEYRAAVEFAKTKGLEVREYAVTGGMQAQMVIDPSIQERIGQCSSKREKHRDKADWFRRWVAVLESQDAAKVYDLSMDDALYFGVAKGELED